MQGWGVLAIVPAFGIDTLAVGAGLGLAGRGDRSLALVFALFEGGMPILGALAGHALGRVLSTAGVWGAAALLAVLGGRELAEGWRELRDGDGDDPVPARSGPLRGWAVLAAGLGVSMDELGAGLAAGAARLDLAILVPALAVQAMLCTYLGMRAGVRLRRLLGRYGELAAGAALLAVGIGIALAAAVRG